MRRAAPILLLTCLLAGAASAAAAVPPDRASTVTVVTAPRVVARWQHRVTAATAYAQRRDGRIGYAVLDHRGLLVGGWRVHQPFGSASVFKAMLAVCYLNRRDVAARALTREERSRLGAMLTRSSDPAANTTYGQVSQACIRRLARNVGMRGFRTDSHWGRTQITPYGTANLFFRIDRRFPPRHRARAMRWLRGVVPAQRWGLAQEVPAGMAIAFKGGFAFSFGGGHTISQGALLSAPNGHRLGIAVLTNHSPTAGYGHATIEGIGRRLLRGYRPLPAVGATSPGRVGPGAGAGAGAAGALPTGSIVWP